MPGCSQKTLSKHTGDDAGCAKVLRLAVSLFKAGRLAMNAFICAV